MGTDIHVCTEVRSSVYGRLQWRNCDNFRLNKYYDPVKDPDEPEYTRKDIYRERHYDLFSLLAGVRDRGVLNLPVAEPKGYPSDMSKRTAEEVDREDGHTPSYLTIAEIRNHMEHNPDTVHQSGLLSVEAAKALDEDGTLPETWCQGTSDTTAVHRKWERPGSPLKGILESMIERAEDEFWVWGEQELSPEQMSNFRIVFWFDS